MPFAVLGLLKNWKLIGLLVLVVGLGLSLWAAYAHYQGLIHSVDELTNENAKVRMLTEIQSIHVTQQKTALHEWKKAQDELVKNYHELSKVTTESRKETSRLHDIFTKHNLGALAAKKPGLIERRINSGTLANFRMLECQTGHNPSCIGDFKTGSKTNPSKP